MKSFALKVLISILVILGVAGISYAVVGGLLTALFTFVLKSSSGINYWTSTTTFLVAGIMVVLFCGWYFGILGKYKKVKMNSGFMPKKEFDLLGNFTGKEAYKNKYYVALTDSSSPKGWILDAKVKHGECFYKHYNPGCHMLVYGMSRSGKTSGYVLPTIYANAYSDDKPCFIITDPKGELYERSVNLLKEQGYRIYKLDIIDANHSNKINPLSDIWDAYQLYQDSTNPDTKYQAHQDLTDLVDELIMALVPDDATKRGDDIWTVKGRDYWKMIIYYNLDLSLFDDEELISKKSFTMVKLLNDFNNYDVQSWKQNIKTVEDRSNKKDLVHLYKSVLNAGEDAKATFEGIKANASMATSFISNASVIKLTEDTDINLKDFDEQPTALFIVIDNDRPNLKNITNIYLKKVIRAVSSKKERGNNPSARPIYLIGDEIGNIPPIYNLDGLLTTCLYKKIFVMLIFQDKQQLTDRYGKNGSVIANNCDLSVIVKVKNLEQAREWSGAFGTYTVKKRNKTTSSSIPASNKGKTVSSSTSESEYEKDIISAGELLKLPPRILIWIAGMKPIVANRVAIHDTKWFKNNVKVNKELFKPEKLEIEEVEVKKNREQKVVSEVKEVKIPKVKSAKEHLESKKKSNTKKKKVYREMSKEEKEAEHKKFAKIKAINKNKLAKQLRNNLTKGGSGD